MYQNREKWSHFGDLSFIKFRKTCEINCIYQVLTFVLATQFRNFITRILVASNAIETTDEMTHLIIHCLNCIRPNGNATYKTGLIFNYAEPISSP